MGATCDCELCCQTAKPSNKITLDVPVNHPDWADAVTKNILPGIRGLHAENPLLINEHVDKQGYLAIHYAVRSKNDKILQYLLSHDADINARGGPDYNTPLHEAILCNNFLAVRHLYSHTRIKLNDKLKNNKNKTAEQLCDVDRRRELINAKNFGFKGLMKKKKSALFFRGKNLDTTSKGIIQKIVKENSDETSVIKKKIEEIKHRESAVTEFGEDCGVDLDEIAMVLVEEEIRGRERIWKALTKSGGKSASRKKNKKKGLDCVTKQTEIRKILVGLRKEALKNKYGKVKPRGISDEPLKQLTRDLVKKLPKKNGKTALDKDVFTAKFHIYLFQLHNEMVSKSDL